MTAFTIPERYADKLEPIEVTDERTDEEILASINQYVPVTSEKNIWSIWYDGVLNMPAWCKRNAVDWVRILGPEWTVRILDNIEGSPNYALNFLSPENLPDCFVNRTMDGPHIGQHAADFVRTAAILEHGGAVCLSLRASSPDVSTCETTALIIEKWMDTGSIMVMHMDRICWDRICDPNTPHEVATVLRGDQWIFNYFIAARKNNPFIRRLNDLILHLWKGRTNKVGVTQNALFAYIAPMMAATAAAQKQAESQDDAQGKPSGGLALFDWKVTMPELLDYAMQMVSWNRVAILEDAGDGFSGAEYWSQHMLLLDFGPETGMPMMLLGAAKNGGARTLELLTMGRKLVDESSEGGEQTRQGINSEEPDTLNNANRKESDDGKASDIDGKGTEEGEENAPNATTDDDWREAERVVWETLSHGSMWKISHVKGLTHKPQLGTLLDAAENTGKDQAAGTYMELLRYGTVHFRQKREGPSLREAPRPVYTLKKGLVVA